jgi:uracil-DNA glycosylase
MSATRRGAGGTWRIAFNPSWDSWRDAARSALLAGIAPEQLVWESEDPTSCSRGPDLFSAAAREHPTSGPEATGGASSSDDASRPAPSRPGRRVSPAPRVPRRFVQLGEAAACHSDPGRWTLLYRLLWRLTRGEPHLLDVLIDPDVRSVMGMERGVRRASHKMKAFVRFRATGGDADPFVAWFEPEHPVVERVAPFFARRFAGMKWSILTPARCAHWDLHELRFTPGVQRSAAPGDDALEDLWRTYYANIFNPARLNSRAMLAELPKMYWKNLPEAHLIETLRRDATARARRMVERTSSPATEPALRPERTRSHNPPQPPNPES